MTIQTSIKISQVAVFKFHQSTLWNNLGSFLNFARLRVV